ncbi:MAG: hypothetical protein EZS28_036911 [Streblomastix strix]|uniref:rRNA biogenesis protein RRP36 n=1 Tax=Streblomastix strix TaxID=222440 RepID=A0A5J4UCG7_9EUKA|nr:MAG: hypothetical protein EZS28_036911 [Streblomastix strix]
MGKKLKKSQKPYVVSSKQPFNPLKMHKQVKLPRRNDPRFDPLCGKLNEDLFNKSYGFIDELKKKELDYPVSKGDEDNNWLPPSVPISHLY